MDKTKTPAKKWRLIWGAGGVAHRDLRSYPDVLRELKSVVTECGFAATVYRWEDGDWALYERFDAGERV